MRKIAKVLFVLAILSFIIIFALKMENNNEMKQYYYEKEEKAKQELTLLQDSNSQLENEEFFIITDKEIEVMNQATKILYTMNDFEKWCNTNFETHAPQCYYVFEDFLIDNGGLISQIENVINN